VVGQLSIWRQRELVVTASVGLVSAGVAALACDAVTDRDWIVSGWEWPADFAAAVILTLVALWSISLVSPTIATDERSSVRNLVKSSLERRGYRIGRLPPLASEHGYALDIDFEYVLAHYLEHRSDARQFFFVQVGAFDGITHDRLHWHVLERGWHGIVVEPQPRYFEKLLENYERADGLTFVNAAVDRERGSRTLYGVASVNGEPIDRFGHLASFSRAHLLDWLRRDGHRSGSDLRITGSPVRCLTFDDVLSEVDDIDLLYIDAEGYDVELLKLFDFGRLAPAIVRFEHVHLSRNDWNAAVRLLARHGYRTVREEYDTTAYRQP
jgi:FkbM family methyltransferase